MSSPRKLLSIGRSYIVGLNRRLANEMARLGQDQWDVTVVSPEFFQGDLRPLRLQIEPEDICKITGVPVFLGQLSQPPHVMAYGGQLRQILRNGWDLVHCWEEPYIFSGGQIAWWMPPEIPLVYFTFQNNSKHYPPPFNWIERYAMDRATGWICSGQTVVEALADRPGYNRPMRLIPYGVDTSYFAPNTAARKTIRDHLEWADSNIPVVGYLGRFVPEKGLNLLMRSLDRVTEPWRALFVGTGPLEGPLRQWATRYPGRVRICTEVHHHQVSEYLNAMDLLCAPSQTAKHWREQFGRMLIEAFACGLPVIGSNSGEIPYVIGEAGVVVDERDEDAWVQAISRLLSSPTQRAELSQRGLHRAHSRYAWTPVARQYLEFFESLLTEERSHSSCESHAL
jgi:glycosyltransferase involved in cell wall biosynthesis